MGTLPKQLQSPPELLTSVRALAGPVFIVAGWSLMSVSFWGGVFVFYFGCALCLAECIWEPWLVQRWYGLHVILIGVLFAFVTWFSINIVFAGAPMQVSGIALGPVYNLRPGGLNWKPFYSELDIIFVNSTGIPYENFNALVRPDVPVTAIAQEGNLFGVSFADRYGLIINASLTNEQTHEVRKPDFLATDAGYSINCPEIPPHTNLHLVLAVVGIKESPPPTREMPSGSLIHPLSMDNPVFTVIYEDEGKTFHYWFGSKQNTEIYEPSIESKQVTVRGSYVSNHKSHALNLDLPVKKIGQ